MILHENGHANYPVGKWHLAPMLECSQAGPWQLPAAAGVRPLLRIPPGRDRPVPAAWDELSDNQQAFAARLQEAFAATGRVPKVLRMLRSTGMDIGVDRLSPVTDDYDAPFAIGPALDKAVFEMLRRRRHRGRAGRDVGLARAAMARDWSGTLPVRSLCRRDGTE